MNYLFIRDVVLHETCYRLFIFICMSTVDDCGLHVLVYYVCGMRVLFSSLTVIHVYFHSNVTMCDSENNNLFYHSMNRSVMLTSNEETAIIVLVMDYPVRKIQLASRIQK